MGNLQLTINLSPFVCTRMGIKGKKKINLKLLNVLVEFRRVARDPRWSAGRSLNTAEENFRRVQFGVEVNCRLCKMLSVS
jgi:hypothetical protein